MPTFSNIAATDSTSSDLVHTTIKHSSTPAGGWSSIIGIVCALVGNVLISFALNTQRYAHLRLQKEAESEDDGTDLADKKIDDTKKSYGTVQRDIADERSKKNAQSQPKSLDNESDVDGHTHDESSALIPSIRPSSSHGSAESASTAHPQDEKSTEHHKRKSYLRSPWWWLGIALMTIGEAGNFLAYGFAPASIVSPLGVVALVSNCIIAPFMLKERFRLRDLAGVIIAVGGAVTVVLSAEGSNPKLGPHEIVEFIKRWEFLLYLGITLGAIVILMILSNKFGDRTIIIDIGLVGLFGGYTALSTKGVASLLSYRLFYVFTFPITYVLVIVLVVTAIMQIKYLNRALQRFDSTQVIPTQFVTFTLFVVLGSAILYRDFEKTTKEKIIQFIGGVALTFLGVWCITGGRSDSNDGKDDKDGDEETPKIALVDEEAEEERNSHHQNGEIPQPRRTSSTSDLPNAAPVSAASTSAAESFVTAASTLSTTSTASTIKPEPSSQQRPPTSHATSTPNLHLPSFSPSRTRSSAPKTPPSTSFAARNLLRPTASPRHASDMSLTPSTTSPRKTKYPQYQPDPSLNAYHQQQQAAAKGVLNRHASLVERVLSLPGPLTSPLSSGLSAIVADNLRRVASGGQGQRSRRGSLVDGAASGRRRTSERGRRPSAFGDRSGSRVRGESVAVGEEADGSEGRENGGADARRDSGRR